MYFPQYSIEKTSSKQMILSHSLIKVKGHLHKIKRSDLLDIFKLPQFVVCILGLESVSNQITYGAKKVNLKQKSNKLNWIVKVKLPCNSRFYRSFKVFCKTFIILL